MKKRTVSRIEPVPVAVLDAADQQNVGEQIAARAYELYQQRGGVDGHDVEDWLQAEREITAQGMEPAA